MSPAKRIALAGNRVKGRIVSHGVKLSALAEAAGISSPSVTAYLQGRTVRHDVRSRIWKAYRDLSGDRVTFAEFWGPLLDEEREAA